MNKKLLLSIVTIGAFVGYGIFENTANAPATLAASDTSLPQASGTDTQSASTQAAPEASYTQYIAQVNAQAAANTGDEDSSLDDDPEESSSASTASTQTTSATTQTSSSKTTTGTTQTTQKKATSGQYTDGTYTGSSVNVYYGNVQVAAVISGGKLTDVKILQYPNDRHESIQRSNYALPQLTQEAITAQSAQVSSISGASATSQGFVESLSSALSKARA